MRARNREINIFNMSLLDILCGALGAFCFMTLSLLPFYKPPGKETKLHEEQQRVLDSIKDLDDLKRKLKDAESAQAMNELVQKLERQIKEMQGEMNRRMAEMQNASPDKLRQLEEENKRLAKDKEKAEQESFNHRWRKPVMLYLWATDLGANLDMYALMAGESTEGRRQPPFDMTKERQSVFWGGDFNVWHPARSSALWIVRNTPPQSSWKIYARMVGKPEELRRTWVRGAAHSDEFKVDFPSVELLPERPVGFLGTLLSDADRKFTFKEATPAERDAEWREIAKNLPAATPSPKPAPQPTPPSRQPTTEEERRALIEKRRQELERMRQQREQQPPPR